MVKPTITSLSTLLSLDLQRYERYLPTAFDDSMTMLQKMNKVIDYLNEIGAVSNEAITQWNTVYDWIMGEGLTEEVSEKIDAMVTAGTFDEIINGTIFQEFNERLSDLALNPTSYNTLQLAITDAVNTNRFLDLGNTSHVVTDSLTGVHDVKLKGTGNISRGGYLFYAEPKGTQTNTLYVNNATGNDTFDGLTPDKAFRTLQKALDVLKHYGQPILKGQWVIQLAAGTYSRGYITGVKSENQIKIQGASVGGHPTVPTTLISEGAGISAVGLRIEYDMWVLVKDIKISGYNGTTSSSGLGTAFNCVIDTDNVHTEGCYYGISAQHGEMRVPNGIHENHNTGFRSLQLVRHAYGIQNAGVRTNTLIVRNCTTGFLIQEMSSGHIDYCQIINCTDGVHVSVNGRANVTGSLFQDCFRGIRVASGGNAFVPSGVEFVNCNAPIARMGGGTLVSGELASKDYAYSMIDGTLESKYVNTEYSSASNVDFHTLTLKAPFWKNDVNSITPMKKIEAKIFGQIINNTGAEGNGTKSLTMRFGGQVVSATFAITEDGTFQFDTAIYFVNPTTQFMTMQGTGHINSSKQSMKTVNVDMSVDQTIEWEVQTAQILDKMKIHLIEVKSN